MKQDNLTTADLKEMPLEVLNNLAEQYATKITWLESTGKDKQEPERFKRTCLELYHIAAIIEDKENK